MKKSICNILLGSTIALFITSNAFGAGWIKDDTGWWYSTNDSNTEWLSHGWHWVDGNNDGIAECYWFNENGYIAENFISMDGFTCNEDGAWHVNGVVQTKQIDIRKEASNESSNNTGAGIGWRQDANGKWYSTNEEGTEWLTSWQWIDDDNDGTAECYYFNAKGYMLANTGQNGEQLNENGQWVRNGVIQTKDVSGKEPEKDLSYLNTAVDSSKNSYNEYGVSNIALDMMKSTRAENDAKYEVDYAEEVTSVVSYVYYKNGFCVLYAEPSSGTYKRVAVTNGDYSKLFKYYDKTIDSPKEAENYLLKKGLWTYGWGDNGKVASDNIACFIGVGSETVMWQGFRNNGNKPSSLHLR